MSATVTVKTQAEFDKAFAELKDDWYSTIIIDSPRGVWLQISASGSATVEASGSATVEASGSATVRASGSATVEAYESATVRAYESATVEAYESATVEAYGSATVRAYGSATVRAYESATVRAYESATVEAYESATVRAYGSATVRAGKYVAVHLFSARVDLKGGVVVDIAKLDRSKPADWADYHGVTITKGTAEDGSDELIVYKAVNDKLRSGRGFTYPIGETIEDSYWSPGDFCGGGLHFSPHAFQAKYYFDQATRFLECAVSVAEISIIDGNRSGTPKVKAKRARVLREVTIDGNPIEVTL